MVAMFERTSAPHGTTRQGGAVWGQWWDFDDDKRVLCRERSGDRGVEESLMNACLLSCRLGGVPDRNNAGATVGGVSSCTALLQS